MIHGILQTVVSTRDKDGKNNALAVGWMGNVGNDPERIFIGIAKQRYSHQMIRESGCFVVNLVDQAHAKEMMATGTLSGRNQDKLQALGIQWRDGDKVDAPILTDYPVSIECKVVGSEIRGNYEIFIGHVEAVHFRAAASE